MRNWGARPDYARIGKRRLPCHRGRGYSGGRKAPEDARLAHQHDIRRRSQECANLVVHGIHPVDQRH